MTSNQLSTGDPELVDLVRRITEELGDDGNAAFNSTLWGTMTDAELHLIGLDEAAGGAGGSTADLVATVYECGRTAAAVPLVENFLAQWVRVQSGIHVQPGVSLIVPVEKSTDGSTVANAVAWANHANEILALDQHGSWTAATSWDLLGGPGSDLAGQETATVALHQHNDAPSGQVNTAALRSMVDLLRSAQMAGAIRGCFDLSRKYASEREQFGVRIDTFPAVQQYLVQLAQAAAISRASVFRAAAGTQTPPPETTRAARLVCDRAARDAARSAHQVHGAIGMTREYRLAGLTRRLNWWRLTDQPDRSSNDAARDFISRVWLPAAQEAPA